MYIMVNPFPAGKTMKDSDGEDKEIKSDGVWWTKSTER